MSLRSWLETQYLRWTGGPPLREDGEEPQPVRPGDTSPVLRELVARAAIPPEVQSALESYRRALAALTAKRGAGYRAGMLEEAQQALSQAPIPDSLGASVLALQALFQDCADVVFRDLLMGGRRPALVIAIDGLVSDERLELSVLGPLTRWGDPDRLPNAADLLTIWLTSVATATGNVQPLTTIGEVVDAVTAGDSVLLVDGLSLGVRLAIPGWERRAVEEPVSEANVRGPRDGFTETLRTNTTLIRRRLRSPHLKVEQMEVGRRTKSTVAILYLKDIASPKILAEVRRRMAAIDVDGVLDSGTLEEFLEDQPTSPFPQLVNTERPDRATANLLEGHVVILVDGSPFALIAPATFWTFLHASEDYYERFWIGTFLLWLRYVFALLSLLGPSFYVAITTYHQEMLPTNLLLSIAAAREGVPFPALVEVLLMEIVFEALREAGIRLPQPVGQAISIVGALVIGEAAVSAGIASSPVVIVVGLTGIGSFTFPRYSMAITFRLLRFPMLFLASIFGLFGINMGLLAILIHLCALRSFGVPYLTPIAPLDWSGLKDVLLRAPLWLMDNRPPRRGILNRRRHAPWLKPGRDGP